MTPDPRPTRSRSLILAVVVVLHLALALPLLLASGLPAGRTASALGPRALVITLLPADAERGAEPPGAAAPLVRSPIPAPVELPSALDQRGTGEVLAAANTTTDGDVAPTAVVAGSDAERRA